MNQLYPLKFKPIFQERIWGGTRLKTSLNKDTGEIEHCGESWELSSVENHLSVVSNGFLEGNDILELVEIYMGDLVGEKIYDKYGIEFPLLIKFIDATQDLSIQVHPGDQLAKERHGAYGKTEMWYVISADPGSRLNSGFNQPVDREKYLEYLKNGKLTDLLNFVDVHPGDAFFIPAGRVHAIGKGILLAEIQQTSDVTYRIFDYNRTDKKGKKRKLHTELALEAIRFETLKDYRTTYSVVKNKSSEIVSCPYFTTRIFDFDQPVLKDYSLLDSFVIYICIGGGCSVTWEEGMESVYLGDTVLIPATLGEFTLAPVNGNSKLLEVYIA